MGPIDPPPRSDLARHYGWLYTPPAHREAMAVFLLIERELAATARRPLDHSVAHARLAWWQEELERLRAGEPRHPATKALQSHRPDLRPLAALAALQLARASLGEGRIALDAAQLAREWSMGLFVPLAALLAPACAAVPGTQRVGAALYRLESGDADRGELVDAWKAWPAESAPPVRGLFVWSALAARSARIPDLLAWRAARRAMRGHPELP